jgi:acyl carrier protein
LALERKPENELGTLMEIPGNDFKGHGKIIQDRPKVTGEKSSKTGAFRAKGAQAGDDIALSSKAKDIQKSHEKFLALLEELLELEQGSIKVSDQLNQLEDWDSLAVISLLVEVDKHFGITLEPEKVVASQTINDLIKLLPSQFSKELSPLSLEKLNTHNGSLG